MSKAVTGALPEVVAEALSRDRAEAVSTAVMKKGLERFRRQWQKR